MFISKMMLRTSLSAVVLLGMTLNASALELTSNGDFETGDTSGWESFPTGSSTFIADTISPFAGSYNGKVENTATGSAAVIKQANLGIGTVAPGQDIEISFWARGSAEVGGVHFAEFFSEIDGGGTSSAEILGGGPLFPPSATDWTEYTFSTTAGADVSAGVTLQLVATTGASIGSVSTLEIDNVSVSIIPEPTSLVLLSMAGLAVVSRRRRR